MFQHGVAMLYWDPFGKMIQVAFEPYVFRLWHYGFLKANSYNSQEPSHLDRMLIE